METASLLSSLVNIDLSENLNSTTSLIHHPLTIHKLHVTNSYMQSWKSCAVPQNDKLHFILAVDLR